MHTHLECDRGGPEQAKGTAFYCFITAGASVSFVRVQLTRAYLPRKKPDLIYSHHDDDDDDSYADMTDIRSARAGGGCRLNTRKAFQGIKTFSFCLPDRGSRLKVLPGPSVVSPFIGNHWKFLLLIKLLHRP